MMDFSLVPTDDLLEALKARYDHVVFGGYRVEEKPGKDTERRFWNGHGMWCQALACELIRAIQDWERESDRAAE